MRFRVAAIIIAGFATIFVAFGIRYSYGILLPEMLSSMAISNTEGGIIYSSYFLTYTLGSPLLGLMVDRTSARIILTVFVALLGVGASLMATASTVFQASLFFAIAGLGHSACWAPVVTIVMRWVSQQRRGILLSVVDLGSACSIAFWSLMIPIIIIPFDWRMVWIFLGLVALMCAGMNFFFIKDRPPATTKQTQPGTTMEKRSASIRDTYRTIFSDRKFHLIALSYLMISFSILIPFTFLTAYSIQKLHIPYSSAASLIAVIGISGAVAKLILGYLSDKVGRVRIMMLCSVIVGVGGVGMALVQNFSLLVISTIFFGAGYGTIWPQYAASARDLFSEEHSGSVIGLWTLYHGLGSMLAPVIAGWSIDATGSYFWAFIMTIASAVFSLLLLLPALGPNNSKKMAS